MKCKPRVAFFDFTCCEGCQLQVANLEEHILDLVELVELVEFREVMTDKAENYDIAFVEGSITRKSDEKRLQDIRRKSEIIVAYGQCAVSGGINRLKNNWQNLEDVKKCVYGDHFSMPQLDTYSTRGIDEIIEVDLAIPGCPINKNEFLRVVKELCLGIRPRIPNYPVCVECKLKENICLFDNGLTCLGPLARAGCNAICPSNGSPCDACRGSVDNPNQNAMWEVLRKFNYTNLEIKRRINLFGVIPEVKG